MPEEDSIWDSIREAVRGGHRDYTEGPLGRAIILLAIPMVLETSMESLFAVVDIFWVAKLGDAAVATVGITESLMSFVFAIALGLSFSTTAFVARRIGEKDPELAARGAVQSIAIGLAVSAAVGLIGILFAPQLLALMGAQRAVLEHSAYTRIVVGGSSTVMMLFLMNAVFRGAGDAMIAMRVLWLANIINMCLNPCLIFGLGPFPALGVKGSAIGTVIGRGCGVAYQFYCLFRAGGRIQVLPAYLRIERELMMRILRPAFSGMFQIFVATASWTAMVRIAATFGSTVIAGYTLAIRVVIFSILPSWGLCNAAATLVGQNLGAGKPDRAERSVWKAAVYNMYFLGTLAAVYILFAERIFGIFTSEAEVIQVASECLRYISYAYVFVAYGMMMQQAFNGAGDTFTPTMINLACYWAFQIPLAYTLALVLGFGPRGVFMSITAAETALAVVASLAFRRGTWKTQRI